MSVTMRTLATEDEWRANRINGLGGSDIAAVVGLNPYMTNVQLWNYKTGREIQPDIGDKPYVKYGHAAESHLRELFALDFPEYQVHYVENNSFCNTKYPWAQASLDGWLTDQEGHKGVLEIKTTEILNPMQREKWHDKIPDNYYCQVLLYMAVIEADFAVLKAQLKSTRDGDVYLQTKHYKIERSDVQDDIEYLTRKGAEFWELVKSDKRPALLLPQI